MVLRRGAHLPALSVADPTFELPVDPVPEPELDEDAAEAGEPVIESSN